MGSSSLSAWITDQGAVFVAYAAVGVILWGAAAIARLSPPLALGVAWFGAVLQMSLGLPPAAFDLGILVVLFATAAWGTRRLLWIGGVSALVGGLIGGGYFGIVWSGE